MTPRERIDKVWAEWDGLDMGSLMEATRATIVEVTNEEIERQQQLFSQQIEEISNLKARIVELAKQLMAIRRGGE